MKATLLLYLIAGCLLLPACSSDKAHPTQAPEQASGNAAAGEVVLTQAQFEQLGIQLGNPTRQQLGVALQLSGEIDLPPAGLVNISVPYGGFLRQTNLLPGQTVRKGQLLALLEHPDYVQLQQDYLDTETRLTLARLEYDRQRELAAEKVNALKTLQQAEAEVQLLLHNQAALREKLIMLHIDPKKLRDGGICRTIRLTSPINGFVKSVNANVGKMVNASDVLFELVNTDDLHVKLNAFEKDVHRLNAGQPVTFRLASDSTERKARIILVGRSVEADKVVPVHAHPEVNDAELLPGMFVTATVETESQPVLVLPETAVVQYEGKAYVFVDGGNYHFRRVAVATGVRQGGMVEVQSLGLPPASGQVVVKGAHNLLAVQVGGTDEE
jgi:cobalt-zinc-cadmium efflux system membrane fusion protein